MSTSARAPALTTVPPRITRSISRSFARTYSAIGGDTGRSVAPRACIVLTPRRQQQMTVHSIEMTAVEMSAGLAAGRWSAVELVRASLDRAASIQPTINAFVELHTDEALADAKASDHRRGRGSPLSALDGIPIGVKDAIGIGGHTMIAGSGTTPAHVLSDAEIVRQLRGAGAVIIGRTRVHEVADRVSGPADRWIEQRLRRSCGCRSVPGGGRDGHRRIDQGAGNALQRRWIQADIRPSADRRRPAAGSVHGSRRLPRANE